MRISISLALGAVLVSPTLANDFVAAALERTRMNVRYDGAYVAIGYPNGDVPNDTGVCTDLVIRAYRAIGVDLQRLVHEDMKADFNAYPKLWGHVRPDTNIDHRRVPNLEVFFERNGQSLSVSRDPDDYQPGDVVTWRLPGDFPHIGIVSSSLVPGTSRPKIIHNIGNGPTHDDILFEYRIFGHYRLE